MQEVVVTLLCKTCNKWQYYDEFSKHKDSKGGRDTSQCKSCKKSAWDWSKVSFEKRMLNRTKARAKRKGLTFDLELSDIILPEYCPVFFIDFEYGHIDWTYSIDRIDNNKGYVKGNIQIVSNKANRLKGDASVEDIEMLLRFMKRNACEIT